MALVRLFRYTHPDGSAKDWAVALDPDPEGLDVYYGVTGKRLSQARTPRAKCAAGSPDLERETRVREKVRKGYQDLGAHRLADDGRTLARAPAADGTPLQPPPPCLYWRWKAARQRGLEPCQDAVVAAAAEAAARLAAVGWAPERPPDAGGEAIWPRYACGASAGLVPVRAGSEPLIAFWLVLARCCPEIAVVGEDRRPASWPAALPADPDVLERLGLKEKDLNALLGALDGAEQWYWG